jgi:ribonuclease HII
MSTRTILTLRHTDDSLIEAGIDEAGRGCFWGPIMAGALIWPPQSEWTDAHHAIASEIRDSKKIAPKKRQRISQEIQRLATAWGVGSVSAKEIDDHGITWANQEAFRRAIADMGVSPQRIIIDGTIGLPGFSGEQHNIVEGDGKYIHVAGASILAKVAHDTMVINYCAEHPECEDRYKLLSGHGYGTAKHREGLRNYGAHELHRRTFIYNWIGETRPERPPRTVMRSRQGDEPCLIRLSHD